MRTIMIAAALGLAGTPAIGQDADVSGGLVNVTIDDTSILNNSLNENELELLSRNNVALPVSVQVPIGIAANVCNVSAAVLAADLRQDGEATCEAESSSRALGQQVLRQTVRGNR